MMKPIKKLDEQEVKIIRELIRNPRISDNGISKRSKVPVMTVNRKRKALEDSGIISYYADINHGEGGIEDFFARQLYIIKFKIGITRHTFLENIRKDKSLRKFNAEHIVFSYLAEKDGHLAITLMINAHTEADLNETFNGGLVPMYKRNFGDDCIISTDTVRILEPIRKHHNYIYGVNLKNGKIIESWPDEYIFVNRENVKAPVEQSKLEKHL